jgi:hypothetical protein
VIGRVKEFQADSPRCDDLTLLLLRRDPPSVEPPAPGAA